MVASATVATVAQSPTNVRESPPRRGVHVTEHVKLVRPLVHGCCQLAQGLLGLVDDTATTTTTAAAARREREHELLPFGPL